MLEVQSINSTDSRDYRHLFQFLALGFDQAAYTRLFSQLMHAIHWQDDGYTAFDRHFAIPRQQAWYADTGIEYRYADNLLRSQPWLPTLLNLKSLIEQQTGCKFNAVLATLYRNGNDSVGWHADDEKELGSAPVIASLSLGASRRFELRHRHRQEQGGIVLHHGDCLLMPAGFQQQWQHRIPAEPQVTEPRINLTFRYVYRQE